MTDTLTPARPTALNKTEAAPHWRNLWFLADPPGTVWGEYSYPSQEAAEQIGQENAAEFAAHLAIYGDHHCAAPFDWLLLSRVRWFVTMPDPGAP